MNAAYQNLLRRSAAVAFLLSACIAGPLSGQVDLSRELDEALHESGRAGDAFDAARLFRLRAIVRQAAAAEQLRLIERRLVESLESDAPLAAKQDACRVLWVIGGAQSAPALEKLLAQPETADIACYAVANNPTAELGRAVRHALGGSSGKVAVSLLNLLGQRRDAEAIGLIVPFLKDGSTDVASAAAVALGKIGSRPAVVALDAFRKNAAGNRRSIADNAYLRAVETLDAASAVAVWRQAIADKGETTVVRRMALLRLSEQAPRAALPWLLAALRDEEPSLKPAAGQALRSLRDKTAVGEAAARLRELPSSSQVIVVEALGPALPLESIVALMRQPAVRVSAMRLLGARGGPQAAAALLGEALSPDGIDDRPEIFRLLKNLPGEAATDALLQALPTAPAPLLSDMVKVLAAREARIPVSLLVERAGHGEVGDRIQAIRALRFAAKADDHAALFALLTSAGEPEIHEAVEETIADVFRRSGNLQEQAGWLLERLDAARRPRDRRALLRLLARTGTSAALQCALKQVRNGSAEDRGAAFAALTQWPNETALAPLLDLAGEPLDEARRVPLLRGAVRLLEKSRLPASKKVECFHRLAPLASDAAGGKLLLSGLANVPDAGALEMILPSLDDAAVRAEAAIAAIRVASHLGPGDDAAVNGAMNKVLAVVQDADLRGQAQAKIRSPRPPLPDVGREAPPTTSKKGFKPLFDGRSFAGWEGPQQAFRIEAGAIVGGSLKRPVPHNDFLCTKATYANFILRAECRLLGPANGGIQIRSQRVPNNYEVCGYQADMSADPDGGFWGCLYDESRRNRNLAAPDRQVLKKTLKPRDWNLYEIRCEGPRIRLFLNGVQTVDYTEKDDKLPQRGIIGLQIHGGGPSEAWYRNIAIEELP